jgi:hypothetical protein
MFSTREVVYLTGLWIILCSGIFYSLALGMQEKFTRGCQGQVVLLFIVGVAILIIING